MRTARRLCTHPFFPLTWSNPQLTFCFHHFLRSPGRSVADCLESSQTGKKRSWNSVTELGEDAHEDDNHPSKSTPHSRKSSAPILHDVTLTRRPRFPDNYGTKTDINSKHRIPERLLGTSLPHVRPTTSVTTTLDSSATSLQNSRGNRIIASDTDALQRQVQVSASTIFHKTVQDLEGLLNEALHIAQVAADDNDNNALNTLKLLSIPAYAQDVNPLVLLEDLNSASPDGKSLSLRKLPLSSKESPNAPAAQQYSHKQGPHHGMRTGASGRLGCKILGC